jgi:hypothetical protein
VLVDGAPLPEEEARAFWGRFSDYMETNKGDLAGFAKQEGFASVHPTMQAGRAVLVASRSTPQKAYTNAPTVKPAAGAKGPGGAKAPGGSSGHQGPPPPARRGDPNANGAARKPPKR